MTSTHFTFDLNMTKIYITFVQSLNTGHTHVQMSGLYIWGKQKIHISNPRVEGIAGRQNKEHPDVCLKCSTSVVLF